MEALGRVKKALGADVLLFQRPVKYKNPVGGLIFQKKTPPG